MKEDVVIELKEELKDICFKISKYNQQINSIGVGNIKQDLYWKLIDFEIKLLNIYDEAGYQTRRADDVTNALS
jgi:hypothetical protein